MTTILRSLPLAAVALLSLCSNVRAWSDPGHKIICEIAFRLAQPDTRAAIQKLIDSDTEFKIFADSCVYPDHPIRGLPRIRATEHYVKSSARFQGARLAPMSKGGEMRAHRDLERRQGAFVERYCRHRSPNRPEISRALGRRYSPTAARLFRRRSRRQQHQGERRRKICTQHGITASFSTRSYPTFRTPSRSSWPPSRPKCRRDGSPPNHEIGQTSPSQFLGPPRQGIA